jgi:hypothetical protein
VVASQQSVDVFVSKSSVDVVVFELWADAGSNARGEPGTTPCGTECGESEYVESASSSGSFAVACGEFGSTPCGTDTVCCGESEDSELTSSSGSAAVTISTLVWVCTGFDNFVRVDVGIGVLHVDFQSDIDHGDVYLSFVPMAFFEDADCYGGEYDDWRKVAVRCSKGIRQKNKKAQQRCVANISHSWSL